MLFHKEFWSFERCTKKPSPEFFMKLTWSLQNIIKFVCGFLLHVKKCYLKLKLVPGQQYLMHLVVPNTKIILAYYLGELTSSKKFFNSYKIISHAMVSMYILLNNLFQASKCILLHLVQRKGRKKERKYFRIE